MGAVFEATDKRLGRKVALKTLVRGARTADEVADIVSTVADGLSAAHARGLVHRDIKPENVMIRDDGRVALLDFGIAKETASPLTEPLASTLTATGALVGTPMYLAPEQ